MMRKDAFDATGGYRLPFRHAEEYDLWLRMAESYELANLANVLLYYRVHAGQVTTRNLKQQVLSAFAARAAARVRRDAGQDPPLAADGVTIDTLASLAVRSDQVIDELIKAYLGWAELMVAAGEYGCTGNLLRETLVLSRAKPIRCRIAELHVECARGLYLERDPRGAVNSLAKAAVLRPTLISRFLRYAWRALRKSESRVRHT